MPRKTSSQSENNDPLKRAAIDAFQRLAGPLAELMFDTGVTVREFTQIIRERAVWAASKRVKDSGRDSKSRVAIITGLPRAEVARILKRNKKQKVNRVLENPARKVLTAWHDDPRFLDGGGEPAILPIFGRRRSFERLVTTYAKGIPVRAMLDELIEINSVESLSDQTVRAKSRIPILTGLSSKAIINLGERSQDLLSTLTYNLRRNPRPFFQGTASLEITESKNVPLIQREIEEQSSSFINGANTLLRRRSLASPGASISPNTPKYRVGVTVYYFQIEVDPKSGIEKQTKRKNLQRRGQAANNR